jgi:hypothetical protein
VIACDPHKSFMRGAVEGRCLYGHRPQRYSREPRAGLITGLRDRRLADSWRLVQPAIAKTLAFPRTGV